MKLLTEYVEHALTFERLAAEETNPALRKCFEMQAVAYRKLVSERAARYDLPPPSPPPVRARPQASTQPRARVALSKQSADFPGNEACGMAGMSAGSAAP
ncbi:hypothetical protein [Bradyrhizobium paxllaeri]|uniref:hypothetical protein n=1 Tax=Bradyrhizobium paxllaeri TaxID=190148 RepID=UPI0009FD1B20|nr:hypothetical protein [Bradyrhizobium paxllaeri]